MSTSERLPQRTEKYGTGIVDGIALLDASDMDQQTEPDAAVDGLSLFATAGEYDVVDEIRTPPAARREVRHGFRMQDRPSAARNHESRRASITAAGSAVSLLWLGALSAQ
jgi:hypothetical protein